MRNRIDVLVVIVNYRTAELVIACLHSLAAEVKGTAAQFGVHVVVSDNASEDASVLRLQEAVRNFGWSGWVSIQPLERNGGFAFGNNAAIRPALASSNPPQYIWLLNPDTVVRPGALATLVEFLDSHPDAGIAGCRLVDIDGIPEWSAFRFPSVLGELENGVRLGVITKLLSRWVVSPPVPSVTTPCDWASGASLLVRRAVFEAIGLLDENYFMYFEEVDFCLRARRAGWICWYVPQAQVLHLAGQSSGVTGQRAQSGRRPDYWFAARRYYFRKHLGPGRTLLADLAWSLGFLSFRIRQRLRLRHRSTPTRNSCSATSFIIISCRSGADLGGLPITDLDPLMSELGIVTIGRNEGDRLRRCLTSLVGRGMPVVYVDSNSTDDSVRLARSLGAEVVELDLAQPVCVPRTATRDSSASVRAIRRFSTCSSSTATVKWLKAG